MKISKFRAKEALERVDTLVNNIVWDVAYELENTYNIEYPADIEIDAGEHVAYLLGRFEAMQEIADQIKLLTKEIEKNE
tara:strand:- start:541 stop:777 length:237 start_codon:yes stop_codon:yes gene_type:complete